MGHIITHSYSEIIALDNLLVAWEEFTAGKKKRADVRQYAQALLHNILALQDDLGNFSYKHSGYEAFMVNDPKPRSIHKATVRDRLLHRAIYRILYPSFDTTFIHDSYSCREMKGTHKAFNQLVGYCRKMSHNYTTPCFALQMDIRKFFNNIDHSILKRMLKKRIADPDLLGLIEKVIDSFEYAPGKGMPLGNLTSQLFANVYMDPLDKFVKHKLKARYYLRYADDFLVLSKSQDELMGYFVEIWRFLKEELKLDLHPNKISLRKYAWGFDFVGYVARPHYSIPRKRTIERMKRDLTIMRGQRFDKINPTLQSYLGYLKHVNGYRGSVVLTEIASAIV